MIKASVVLNKKDLLDIEDIKRCSSFFMKEIMFDDGKEKYSIGILSAIPQRVTDGVKVLDKKHLSVSIKLAGYPDQPYIKNLCKVEYLIEPGDLDKLIYGEHVVVNPRTGDRIKIYVSKEE